MTVLPLLRLGSEKRALFIYLPLFTQASLTERARLLFRNAPLHPHSVTHIHTSGSQGFPAAGRPAFLLDQPGVNCLAQGHFHKKLLGNVLAFSFTLPSRPQLWDLEKQPFSQCPILQAPLIEKGGEREKPFE